MTRKAPYACCSALLLFWVWLAPTVNPLGAQPQASEKYELKQTIDGVEIILMGSRPSMRGRTIFGDRLEWDASWPAGARTATTLEVGREFSINGKEVPAGRYSLWMKPRKGQPWLMMLDPRDTLGHWAHPDSLPEQHHFHVNAVDIDPVETLTWTINDIRGYGSTVRMEWADKRVEFSLKLKSTYTVMVDSMVATETSGEYSMVQSPTDTNRAGEPREAWADKISFESADDILRLRFHGGFAEEWSDESFMALVPVTDDMFTVAELYDGEIVQIMGLMVEFGREDGRITTYEVRSNRNDELMWSGKKLK